MIWKSIKNPGDIIVTNGIVGERINILVLTEYKGPEPYFEKYTEENVVVVDSLSDFFAQLKSCRVIQKIIVEDFSYELKNALGILSDV